MYDYLREIPPSFKHEYDNLVKNELYVNVHEYKFIIAYEPSQKNNFLFCGWHYKEGESYLNLNLCSEHEHDARELWFKRGS